MAYFRYFRAYKKIFVSLYSAQEWRYGKNKAGNRFRMFEIPLEYIMRTYEQEFWKIDFFSTCTLKTTLPQHEPPIKKLPKWLKFLVLMFQKMNFKIDLGVIPAMITIVLDVFEDILMI